MREKTTLAMQGEQGRGIRHNSAFRYPKLMLFLRGLAALCLSLILSAAARAEQWKQATGKGYIICDAIHKRLNSHQWTKESANEENGFYVWSVVASYPGWKQPPWQEIDPSEHQELIQKLLRYHQLGPDVYYGRKQTPYGEAFMASLDERFREYAKTLGIRVWKTHLINWLDNKPAPPGDQTIVQLYPLKPPDLSERQRSRPGWPMVNGMGGAFVVTDDLRDPDPRVGDYDARTVAGSPALLFGRKLYFLTAYTTGWTVGIQRDLGNGPRTFCEIYYQHSNTGK